MNRAVRVISYLVLCALLLILPVQALGEADSGDVDYLSIQDLRALGFTSTMSKHTLVNERFYALGEQAAIWYWEPGHKEIHKWMSYQPLPAYDERVSFQLLSGSQQEALLTYPGCFFAKGNELWAFNVYTSKIGKIESDGVSWQQQLDKPPINDTSVFLPTLFVSGQYLFGILNNIYSIDQHIQVWELATGKGRELAIPGLSYALPHQADKALLVRDAYTEHPRFAVLDLASGEWQDLPVRMPFACENRLWDPSPEALEPQPSLPYSKFAYDTRSDTLLFCAYGKLWASQEGADFETVAIVPEHEAPMLSHGWVLPDGRYAAWINGINIRRWR